MTWSRKSRSRSSKLLWGALAIVVVALLAISFPFSRRALSGAESDAQAKAVAYTNSVLAGALTPETVQKGIVKDDYRQLIVTVQSDILSDPTLARLRVWRPDGTLLFSSDQRDKVGEFVASDDPQIKAAAGGAVASLVTETKVAPKPGLSGSTEKLYETFAPLHLGDGPAVSAVSQIDHRYASIEAEAHRLLRPAQYVLAAAFVLFVALFWKSFRRSPVPVRAAATVPAPARPWPEPAAADAGALRLAEDAAQRAEARLAMAEEKLKEFQERLATTEEHLRETISANRVLQQDADEATRTIPFLQAEVTRLQEALAASGATASPAASAEIAQLAERVRESESERDAASGEVQRLRAALAAKEADLALARESTTSGLAESSKAEERVRQADQLIAQAEERAREAEDRALQAERRMAEAEARSEEAEARSAEAEAHSKEATGALASLQVETQRTWDERDRRSEADLMSARRAADEAALRLVEVEAQLAEQTARVAALETAEQRASEAQAQLADLQAESEKARSERTSIQTELERSRIEFEQAWAEQSSLKAELERARAELEQSRVEQRPVVAVAEGEEVAKVADLETTLRELEEQRRRDMEELTRAHERLGNTQVELTRTTKRAKELEERLSELEAGEGPYHREPEPEPAGEGQPWSPSPLSRLRQEVEEAGHIVEEAEPASPEEALSLRERLTRAAAARHRVSGPAAGADSDRR